jgi:two-component system, cell cycle sensor histidine kinase DivJ
VRHTSATSVLETRLAGLVHESAQDDPVERSRHERFIITRMLTGLFVLAGLPPYLLWRGVPSEAELVAVVCLVAPVLAAVVLARSGRLALAHAISGTALAGFVVCLALSTGGVSSPATLWLVAVPLEGFLSGSRPAALAASLIAAVAALLIAGLDLAGIKLSMEPWPTALAMPVFAIAAIAHVCALALEHSRYEASRAQAQRARDAQDRSLLQAIDDLVTWHDPNGHVVKASAGALKLIGVPAGSLQGRGLFSRVHVGDRPAFLSALSEAAAGAGPVVVQFRIAAEGGRGTEAESGPAGRMTWVEMRAHRIDVGPCGEPSDYAVVAVTRDISARKRHEEELERARASAERADGLKARFLATVSHELRTPLNAIIGFSEMLSAEAAFDLGPGRRREYAQIVHESGQHLLAVVNSLLDMSKIETGNFDFQPEAFDPASLVHGCCDLLQLKAEQTGVVLVRDIARDLPELVADGRACRQILINLISNALKFTPRGGRVTVGLSREGDRLRFTVADTGIGIAEADLPRLGDPFFQAGQAYDRSHEGTGLGLSVVRGLVGLHRGDVAVESEVGQGTVVTVTLPIDCRSGSARLAAPAIQVQSLPRRTALLKAS